MRNNLLILGSIVIVVLAFVVLYLVMTPEDARDDMGMGGVPGDAPHLPAVMGYLDGEEVYFVHPEASAPEVAGMLTEMMGGSPVLVVPALEDVPESALAIVYVFANGVEGDGPLGFQVDVFNNPPGTEGYSPLRALHRVSWIDESSARLLTSEVEVLAALDDGEITIEQPGVVLNMPLLSWPGGQR